jgi:predicted RNA-binding Zn ribbon-like protein
MYSWHMTNRYRWRLLGGHLALDLCNTVSWRRDPQRTVERLRDSRDVAGWFGAATGHQAPAGIDDVVLDQVHRLRDRTVRLLDAHLDRRPGSADDVSAVHYAWLSALGVAELSAHLPLAETINPTTPALLVSRLALSIGELLHRSDLSTLRRCEGEGCGWLFLDTTRNHSRRWCDPLDCGNRARVRAYARRHRR